ncbi:hypothetical protein K488DRAFT_71155 [Vararia minispora EC-137]|uniref:Uncharacterized protein n=1 Tax=Vararia minispora EC-137 TaxID=1314806 RepID=A0ACB8QIU5_9AGAM|nr:hypothetical protein K488DRAFT_71155 [Vararia minispora EC-137]
MQGNTAWCLLDLEAAQLSINVGSEFAPARRRRMRPTCTRNRGQFIAYFTCMVSRWFSSASCRRHTTMLPGLSSIPAIFDLTDPIIPSQQVRRANVCGWKPPPGTNSMLVSVPSSSSYTYQRQSRYPTLERVRVSHARTSAHPYARQSTFGGRQSSTVSYASRDACSDYSSVHEPANGAYDVGFSSFASPSSYPLASPLPSFDAGGWHAAATPSLPSYPSLLPLQPTTSVHSTFGESSAPSPYPAPSPPVGLAQPLDDASSLYSYSSGSSISPPPSILATPGPELRLPPLESGLEYDTGRFDQAAPRGLQYIDKRGGSFWEDARHQLPRPELERVHV